MAAGRIVFGAWMPAVNADGVPIPNARIFFYDNETTILKSVYADQALTIPLPNPVSANSSGQFPDIWGDDAEIYSATIDAPYGPPGTPFTYDNVVPGQNTGSGGGDDKLDVNGSNIPPPSDVAPSGALALRQNQNLFFFTPEDYGATGDGVTDDTAAIKRAINARRAAGGVLKFARKNYIFSEPLVDYGDYMSWVGDGVALVWNGGTTGDLVTWGLPGVELRFPYISGIKIGTKKNMTSGWMAVMNAHARGIVNDLTIQGIDGSSLYGGRPYDGLYVNGYSYTKLVNLEIGGVVGSRVGMGIRGIPGGAQAGLWINGGSRIGGFDIGVQIGGGNGGVYWNDTDIIGHRTVCVLQNNAYEAQNNREVFWSGTVSIDAGGTDGCYVIDQNLGTCLVVFDGTWICSGQGTLSGPGPAAGFGGGLYLKRGPDTRIIADGVYLHNHGGDAIRCDEPDSEFIVSGMILNNKGYGINRTVPNIRLHSTGVVFRQNLLGDQNLTNPPVADIEHDRIRARNLRIWDGGVVRLDPQFYLQSTGGTDPYVNFNPNTYHRFNRTTGEHEFATAGQNSLKLFDNFINVGGAGYAGYKVVTGTTNGSGVALVAHGISSLPQRIMLSTGFVTEAGGDVTAFVAGCDGVNIGFSGATPSRPFKIGIYYLKDAI